jgi:hypothetical protein
VSSSILAAIFRDLSHHSELCLSIQASSPSRLQVSYFLRTSPLDINCFHLYSSVPIKSVSRISSKLPGHTSPSPAAILVYPS